MLSSPLCLTAVRILDLHAIGDSDKKAPPPSIEAVKESHGVSPWYRPHYYLGGDCVTISLQRRCHKGLITWVVIAYPYRDDVTSTLEDERNFRGAPLMLWHLLWNIPVIEMRWAATSTASSSSFFQWCCYPLWKKQAFKGVLGCVAFWSVAAKK